MVRTIYLVDGLYVSEEEFHNFRLNHEDEHELECYCECLDCGAELSIADGCCPCQFED